MDRVRITFFSIGSGKVARDKVVHEREVATQDTNDPECLPKRLKISHGPDFAIRILSHVSNRTRNVCVHRNHTLRRSIRMYSDDGHGRSSQFEGRIATSFDAIVRSTSETFVHRRDAFLWRANKRIEDPPHARFERYEIRLVHPGSNDESIVLLDATLDSLTNDFAKGFVFCST